MELFSKVLRIEKEDGQLVDIRMPSIIKSEEIRERNSELLLLLDQDEYKGLTFYEAYTTNKKFKKLVKTIMGLVDIESDEINVDYLVQLLLPHRGLNEEGKATLFSQGKLMEFIFGKIPEAKGTNEVVEENLDLVAKLMGDLWAMTEDFQETLNILNTFNYKDLNKILEYRSEALKTPEQKYKEQQTKASKKLMENLRDNKVVIKDNEGEELGDAEMENILKGL